MRNWWAIDGPGFVNTVGKLDSLRCFDGSSTNNSTVACEEIVSNATSKGFNEQHGELALSQLSSIENFTTAYKVCNLLLNTDDSQNKVLIKHNRMQSETHTKKPPPLLQDPK